MSYIAGSCGELASHPVLPQSLSRKQLVPRVHPGLGPVSIRLDCANMRTSQISMARSSMPTRLASYVMSSFTMVDRGIALAKGGDSHALGSLLEGYRAYLRMLARVQIGRRLRSKLDADDLLQEAFLRAHQAIGRFRGTTEEEFLAWLRGILAHVLADQIRRYHGTEQRDPKTRTRVGTRVRAILGGVRPLSSRRRRAAPASGSSATSGLCGSPRRWSGCPPRLARSLTLRHFQDLSFPEIARRMGRTLDGVKNLWIRALARLRREVDSLDELD